MSEEKNKESKKRAMGGGFEQGLKSVLEKAPGMVVPSWATMQTAMAGGAAGGAAAASWRWIIGPAASAALIGGVFWFVDRDGEEKQPEEVIEMVEKSVPSEEVELAEVDRWTDDTPAGEIDVVSGEGVDGVSVLDMSGVAAPSEMVEVASEMEGNVEVEMDPSTTEEPAEVPSDWAELPTEKVAAFGVDIQKACVGTQIGFRMARPMKDVRVLWNFGDGQFSSMSSPQHTFNAPGTYDITLSVTRISDGLIRTRTIENLVTIHPKPEADFTWDVPNTANMEPLVELRDRSRDAASVMWVLDGAETQ